MSRYQTLAAILPYCRRHDASTLTCGFGGVPEAKRREAPPVVFLWFFLFSQKERTDGSRVDLGALHDGMRNLISLGSGFPGKNTGARGEAALLTHPKGVGFRIDFIPKIRAVRTRRLGASAPLR
jgi:hypothetical protein